MKSKKEQEIADAVAHLITCRDFCGDEVEALRDFEAEYGCEFSVREHLEILERVEAKWRLSQYVAGVSKPISVAERRIINRVLA